MGREACETINARRCPSGSRVSPSTIPTIVLLGRETILRNGEPVGYLSSGGYGYTVGKNIGYGYVRNADGVSDDFLTSGDYELVVAKERTPARIHLEPLTTRQGSGEG